MRTEIAIYVGAPPRVVFDLARDVARWPALLPHYRKVTVRSLVGGRLLATMSARRPVGPLQVPVAWRSALWSDDSDAGDLRLHFEHVAGATRGMRVTWHMRPVDGGTRVAIVHDFERRLPLVGSDLFPRLIDRLFVRPIAGRTLAAFKQLAEAGER